MPGEFTAQMALREGRWRLYVVVLNTTDAWAEYSFGRTGRVPTRAERAEALAVLGYELGQDAQWRWVEDSETPDDPASPVLLIAATQVRPVEGDA
ncbi:DUF6303 family protein [Streptomyces sp. NPDC001034]|uniref:DUF6303 family protein n=1 Tax=Streptomyces sp. NPDC001034 TaxID=3154375 RepID=UPI003321BC54